MKLPPILTAPSFQDSEQNRQANILYPTLWFVILFGCAFGAATAIFFPSNILRSLSIVASLMLTCLICFLLMHRGWTRATSILFVLLFWLIVTALVITGGGTTSPSFIAFIIVVLSAGLLLGVYAGLVTGVVVIATEVFIIYAQTHSLLPVSMVHQTNYTLLIGHTFFFAWVIVFVFFYTKSIESAYRQAKEDLDERRRIEKENQKSLHQLGERVKELTALHQTAEILRHEAGDIQTVLDDVAKNLPPAYQYPEVTAARVRLGETEATTAGFDESFAMQRTEFATKDGHKGSIEVVYTQERPREEEGPFLREERALVVTIAEMLQTWYDHQKTAAALRESQATMSAIINSTSDMIWSVDVRTYALLTFNEGLRNYIQRTFDKIPVVGMLIEDIIPPTVQSYWREFYQRVKKHGPFTTEYTTSSGNETLLLNFNLLKRDGELFGISVFAKDITERKKAEQLLRQSEEEFRVMFESAAIGAALVNLEGRPIRCNPALCKMLGYTETELTPKVFTEFTHPEDSEKDLQRYQSMLQGKINSYQIEKRYIRKDGRTVWGFLTVSLVRSPEGSPRFAVGMVEDITARKMAEERMKESEVRYRELVETARDAIYTVSVDEIFTSMNQAFESATGWTREELLGTSFVDIVHPNDATRLMERFGRSIKGEPQPLEEYRIKTKSGTFVLVELSTVPQKINGTVVGVLGIGRDVTERKQLEEQLRRTQRLESIGRVASGIAHDLNNVLGPILLSVDVLEKRTSDESSKQMLNTLRKSSHRGREIVKQVLAFARGTEHEYSPQQMRYLVSEIESLIRQSFPKNIELRSNISKDLPLILGDSTQLHQVLMNLCVNARDAMPGGGRITISASTETLKSKDVESRFVGPSADFVVLSVSDTGSGIPPEIQSKIFKPFFTTKEIGKGTGLGLSTVQSIVKNHKGFIRLKSEPGKGTEFNLYFPALSNKKAAGQKDEVPVLPRGNGEKILVVDDEQSVLHIARETLETYGYTVYTAFGGPEAILIFLSESRGSIPVVVTDIKMPGMSGIELAKRLRAHDPGVKILITSGNLDLTVEQTKSITFKYLAKPYSTEQLLQALHTLIHT